MEIAYDMSNLFPYALEGSLWDKFIVYTKTVWHYKHSFDKRLFYKFLIKLFIETGN